MPLQGKVALVTGSTSGIGLGIAEILAQNGCHIVLNGFGDSPAIEKERLHIEKDYNVKCIFLGADISKAEADQKMIEDAVAQLGSVDILVNNAGIQHVAPAQDFPIEKWQQVIDINLSGPFYAIRAVLPFMQKNNFGRIINIASAHGLVASKGKAAYVASKHGLIGLTKVIALENARSNITCNAVCPGWVLTPLVQKQIDAIAADKNISNKEATEELLGEKQPNVRFASPQEIGHMVTYLASDAAQGVTGSVFSIDGGWTAQ
jgi:3-hydroxybutyrate dehydrogenase